jgi:hypothetical protein
MVRKPVGVVGREIWWYWGPQMKSDIVLLEKKNFPKMRDMAMTSWT